MATQVRSWRGAAAGGGGGGGDVDVDVDGALSQLINKDRSGHCHREGKPSHNDDIAEMRTRDLLGESLLKEIDLDVEPPPPLLSLFRWEKRLDMKSGKVYFHKANSPESVQDLNFPPTSPSGGRDDVTPKVEGNRLTNAGADGSGKTPFEEHDFMGAEAEVTLREGQEWQQSVCTLDKVKMALQRAAHNQSTKRKQGEEGEEMLHCHSHPPPPPPPPRESGSGVGPMSTCLVAAGCPRCLMYVLLPKCDPKCPRCGCFIHKRPRIPNNNTQPGPFLFDLNTPT